MAYHGRQNILDFIYNDTDYSNKYGVAITGRGIQTIKGILQSPVQLNFQTQWGEGAFISKDLMEGGLASAFKSAFDNVAGTAAATLTPTGARNSIGGMTDSVGSQSINQTIKKFNSHTSPIITVNMISFYEVVGDYKSNIILPSLEMISPISENNGELMKSPKEYAPVGNNTGSISSGDCWWCIIGDGTFLNLDYLLCSSFNYTYSRQMHVSGQPYYISCSYTFTTARTMALDDYKRWFGI
jgi:hypothetical protein